MEAKNAPRVVVLPTAIGVAVVLGVAFSRIYLNAYWVSDVLGARADGTALLIAIVLAQRLAVLRAGAGRDVVVVASLSESTFLGYLLGFPSGGRWLEIFNSDVYDNFVNPRVVGNRGETNAGGPPMHGLPTSAAIVIPANSALIFAREAGE